MDPNYDVKAASKYLEDTLAKRTHITDSHIEIPQLGDAQLTAYQVVKFDSPVSWRLASNDDMESEATFRVQGILCGFELPPVQSAKNTQKRRFFMRQSITLTGLSTASYSRAALACENVYAKMSAHFPAESVTHWENTLYEGHIATDFNARYFTTRKGSPQEASLSFIDGVDPDGILAGLRGHDLIHGPDNQVMYLRALEQGYSTIKPATFQIGDVVEVTVAFVILPLKGERYIMIPQLRVVTLLDDQIRQASNREARAFSCRKGGQLKRKVLYVTENTVDETRGKMARMQIDEEVYAVPNRENK